MQHPPQHLPVYLVLLIDVRILLVYAEQLDHVEPRFGLVERNCEDLQSFVVMVGGEDGEVPVEDLDDELGDVGGLALLLLWFFNEKREHSIEGLYEHARIEHDLLESAGGQGLVGLLGSGGWRGRTGRGDWSLFRDHSQYLLVI